MEMAVLACGCFWGAEKGFWRLPGVHSTEVGYAGGSEASPTYETVCAGVTGHAEAVRVVYNPMLIAFSDILRWFWQCHDVTQADGQGNDQGSQYRSAIFFTSEEQLLAVQATRSAYNRTLQRNGVRRPIVTEVKPLTTFYRAESVHQQYLAKPGARPYCSARPLTLQWSAADWSASELSLPLELTPRLSESFWRVHAPTYHCALTLPNEPIVWDDVSWPAFQVVVVEGGPPSRASGPVQGSEELMALKGHGTSVQAVQQQLRWGCDRAVADRITCFNRKFAECRGYWESTRLAEMPLSLGLGSQDQDGLTALVITFFDSVHGLPCFQIGGAGRSWDEFERESRVHGWPSFRDCDVNWENVRVLPDGEIVSTRGAHFGHNLADAQGNRYCINLVSVAGRPIVPRTVAAPHSASMPFKQSKPTAEVYDGPWHDLPPVAIVPLSGEATVVRHEHDCVADSIAEVVRARLGPRAVVVGEWNADVSATAVLFIVEVERDGTGCDAARKFLRQLAKSPTTIFGQADVASKAVGVLGLARSVCSFSAASGGADKFAGAARFQARLVSAGCELLLPMGTSEVELEGIEVAVLPWADAAARAFEALIARRLEALAGGGGAPSSSGALRSSSEGAVKATDGHEDGGRVNITDKKAHGKPEVDAPVPLPTESSGQPGALLLTVAGAALLGAAGSLLVLRAAGRR
jgi:peptide-methionine (S)-S-oxide reductase